jgi:hypothetical protein
MREKLLLNVHRGFSDSRAGRKSFDHGLAGFFRMHSDRSVSWTICNDGADAFAMELAGVSERGLSRGAMKQL